MSFLIRTHDLGGTGPDSIQCTLCGETAQIPYLSTVIEHTCPVLVQQHAEATMAAALRGDDGE